MEQCSSEQTALFYKAELAPDCSVCLLHHPKTEKKRFEGEKRLKFIFLKIANLRAKGLLIQNSPKMKLLAKATDINRTKDKMLMK